MGSGPRNIAMGRRRFALLASAGAAFLPSLGLAQQAAGLLIGQWDGEVEGIGKARLIITGVGADGRVDGRMEFELQSFVSQFADRAHSGADKTNYGVFSGSTLRIESALGGTYDLTLQGDQLNGTYIRGTTFKGQAIFRRA